MVKKVNNINISENQLKVLSLFTKGYNKQYYIREVEKNLKISSRTALLTLNALEKKLILKSETKGKIRLFSINPSYLTKEYFIITESYKKLFLLKNNLLIREIAEKIAPYIKGITLLFGSYAKDLQKSFSDIDILIIGKYDRNGIKKVAKIYNKEISIKQYPLKIFKKERKTDTLLKEIIEDHIVLLQTEGFVELVREWKKSNGA